MAEPLRNETHHECESFDRFFECWLVEQNQYLEELVSASKEIEQRRGDENGRLTIQEGLDERFLRPSERVVKHYEHYYRAKSTWAKYHILSMFSPSWRSSLEDAFLWIGRWRPSMTFHLLYSKSGLQLEARLAELIRGLSTGDLGDLSPCQLQLVNELQKNTIMKEKDSTEKYAKLQETVADTSMVELSHVATELMREEAATGAVEDGQLEANLASKEDGLLEVMQRADDLRLKTLKEVVNILTPVQAVHFLIAAAGAALEVS
ncbi:transcription factor-related [Abeliophyllum distichum]|uniref:Transcription factor-related n=1 Tax=Abeliophyllum distichum TaxID=126358 RepID=A0ABD1SD71_9LAMI